MRPRKSDEEKAYNTLLRKDRAGRTDTPRLCSLCDRQLATGGPYVMVVLSTSEYPRIGLDCGHSLQEVMEVARKLVERR